MNFLALKLWAYHRIVFCNKFENLYFQPFFNFDRFDKEIRKQKMFIERIAHEKKEKESDDKFHKVPKAT